MNTKFEASKYGPSYDFNIDIGGGGDIMSERRRIFRIVLTPTGFPNFCHNFCLALTDN